MIVTPQPSGNNLYVVQLQIMTKIASQPELADLISQKKLYLDWWLEQPFFETDEGSKPATAIYVDGYVLETENMGNKGLQRQKVQYDVYLEHFSNSDPNYQSSNKDSYMAFVEAQIGIHRALHLWRPQDGSSALKRTAGPVPISGAPRMAKLILQSFQCLIEDSTAIPEITTTEIREILMANSNVLR